MIAVCMGLTSQKHQVESLNVRCSNKASETIYFLYQSGIQPPLSGVCNNIVTISYTKQTKDPLAREHGNQCKCIYARPHDITNIATQPQTQSTL